MPKATPAEPRPEAKGAKKGAKQSKAERAAAARQAAQPAAEPKDDETPKDGELIVYGGPRATRRAFACPSGA